jgi:scyllo-inositol 2-dehydrogenase (NADP+)
MVRFGRRMAGMNERRRETTEMTRTPPIRIGIVGLGRAGWGMHCDELEGREAQFEIVAACDVIKARRDAMAQRYGCATYARIADLVADPDVEMVDVATPSIDHVAHAKLALRAGKIVFLEKPICLDYAGAKQLEAAAARSQGALYFRHNCRFDACFQHVREIMASGILGEIHTIKLRRHSYARRDDWQTLRKCGGGLLLNWGPHIIDHALRLLESPVADQWSDLKKIAAVGDAEDHLKIVLTGENGRVVDLEISGGSAIAEPVYSVSGTKGALVSQSEATIRLRYIDPKSKPPRRRAKASAPDNEGGFGSPDTLEWVDEEIPVAPKTRCEPEQIWDHLYAAVRQGKAFPITMDEGMEVMRVVSRARKGTPFEFDS